jgi:hypothetical protein
MGSAISRPIITLEFVLLALYFPLALFFSSVIITHANLYADGFCASVVVITSLATFVLLLFNAVGYVRHQPIAGWWTLVRSRADGRTWPNSYVSIYSCVQLEVRA